jgi:ubiquinone biosynthesis protein UbiJ
MLKTVNKAIELLQVLDPQAKQLIARLDGKALTVNITDINLIITLSIKDNTLTADSSTSSNVLSGNLSSIMELLFNKNLQELLIDKKLDYQGSLGDLKQFYGFMSSIEIDIIYQISKRTSPSFANAVEKPFKKAKDFIKLSRQESIIDVKEYLTEEKRVLVSKTEMNIHIKKIQKLRQDIDRLEAKINLLQGSSDD